MTHSIETPTTEAAQRRLMESLAELGNTPDLAFVTFN